MKKLLYAAALAVLVCVSSAQAQVRITEWMYSGLADEFIEITNVGGSAVDLTGWSYDDDSRNAGTVDLSVFGLLGAGESAIISEQPEADFRTRWGLAASVKILGGNSANLGRSDEINIFDNSTALVDRLTYGDQTIPGTIRTQNFSGNPGSPAALGANNVSQWVLSASGDSFGSHLSSAGDVGNPGTYVIPEPATLALAGLSLLGLAIRRR